jgi:hypothetical protein
MLLAMNCSTSCNGHRVAQHGWLHLMHTMQLAVRAASCAKCPPTCDLQHCGHLQPLLGPCCTCLPLCMQLQVPHPAPDSSLLQVLLLLSAKLTASTCCCCFG